jgi:hypothetical protein
MEYKAIHDIRPKNDKAAKMFKNPVLDKLTSSHTAIPISMLVAFAIGFLYWGTQRQILAANTYFVSRIRGHLHMDTLRVPDASILLSHVAHQQTKRMDTVQYARPSP